MSAVELMNLRKPRDERAEVIRFEHSSGERVSWGLHEIPRWTLPLHPTQIFSSINAFLLCLMLWALYPLRTRDGQIFATGIGLYAVTRFLLESIRNDEPGRFGTNFTISQLVSFVMLALAIGLFLYTLRQRAGSALPAEKATT